MPKLKSPPATFRFEDRSVYRQNRPTKLDSVGSSPIDVCGRAVVKEIEAAKFKEQCLALLDQLDADSLIVTKRGKPVARVLPCESESVDLIGSLRHKIEVRGNLLATGRWRW